MRSKPSRRLSAMLYRLMAMFQKNSEALSTKAPEQTTEAQKYFSLMLGEFFNQARNRSDAVDNGSEIGDSAEFESNPLTEMMKKKNRSAESPDMHESAEGQRRAMWNEGDKGDELSPELGGEIGDSIMGKSDSKLGRTNQHSRITAKLNSVVSESNVPEHVVFNEIGEATHIFDWRRILRQNGSYDVDWSYRNAVIEDGIVRPTLESVPVAVTEILLDTSGSIDEPLLKRFLQECRNILPYSRVKIGCFDTQFYGFKEIKTISDLESMVFEGRHGTSFSAAVSAFSGRADNRIIFTDGDAPMPAQRMDIIWIVFGGKRIAPNGGRVFYVDDDLLKRLKVKTTRETRGLK